MKLSATPSTLDILSPANGDGTAHTTKRNGHIDVDAIKRAASGRWAEILSRHAGIEPEALDGRHHPCPKCGGTDRFRALDDFSETGAVLCNQCFGENNGDGFAALQHYAGIDFKAAVQLVAHYVGMSNGKAHTSNGRAKREPKKPASEATLGKGIEPIGDIGQMQETLLANYAKAKPPITPNGVRQCGGRLVRWYGNRCIRLDGRAAFDDTTTTAVVLLRIEGIPFEAAGKIGERKTHTAKGSINSWLTSGDVTTAETILDVEGVTDLLAVVSAGLPAGWVAVTNTAGAKARGKLPRPWAAGKKIIVAGDADGPGQDGMHRSAAAYHEAGAEVQLAELPYPIEKDHGKDIRDWLLEGNTIAADLITIAVTAEQAAEWSKRPKGQRAIFIGTDESRVVNEGIEALATRENIYQRGGCLVQVVQGIEPPRGIARPIDAPRIATMRYPRIRELLADAAAWWRPTEEGEPERIHPPDWVVKALDARGQWQGLRQLQAVVEVPILRADGTVLQEPGYDSLTGILFQPNVTFPRVADHPSRAQAEQARDTLLEIVEDFPFATEAHKAAWLAALITPFARYGFHGPAPLFLIDANVRGSGKSLLADVVSEINAGREMSRMSQPKDDDETRKRITAVAVAGETLMLLDNLDRMLGNASLDAALTATSWTDRILGTSEMASGIPLFATWYATGNNVVMAADTSRRAVHIRLESPEENPEEREGFHHPDLLRWVRQERPRLAVAAVTILSAYCAAGRPNMGVRPWGSFEAWSDLVRQAIVWAGLPDPGATRKELTSQADREAAALRQLIAGWQEIDPDGAGMTVSQVLKTLSESPHNYDGLRTALQELAPPKDGKTLNARSIGMKLHHLRRRVVDGKMLDRRDERGGAIWTIEGGNCRTSGTSGTKSGHPAGAIACAHAHAHAHARDTTSDPK